VHDVDPIEGSVRITLQLRLDRFAVPYEYELEVVIQGIQGTNRALYLNGRGAVGAHGIQCDPHGGEPPSDFFDFETLHAAIIPAGRADAVGNVWITTALAAGDRGELRLHVRAALPLPLLGLAPFRYGHFEASKIEVSRT
jgi:hypothetical protein